MAQSVYIHRPFTAARFVMLGIFALSLMDAIGKWLSGSYGILQIVFISQIATIFVILIKTPRLRWRYLCVSHQPVLQCVRALSVVITAWSFFAAIRYLPLSEAITINFIAPVFVTCFSVLVIREQVNRWRWFTVISGFVGVFIVTNPTGDNVAWAHILMLVSALAYAAGFVANRILSRTDQTSQTVFIGAILGAMLSGIFMPWQWQTPNLHDGILFILLGVVASYSRIWITEAYKNGEASFLAPFDYTALIWSLIFDAFVFHELPTCWSKDAEGCRVYLGAIIVILCGTLNAIRENRIAKINQRLSTAL